MKINPNDGFFPDVKRLEMLRLADLPSGTKETIYVESRGIPIRLAIAAQIMAGRAANPDSFAVSRTAADESLFWADALIQAYNESQP